MNCESCWERSKKAVAACPESKSLNMCRLCFFGDDPDKRTTYKHNNISREKNMKLVEPFIANALKDRNCYVCGVATEGRKSLCDEHLERNRKTSTIRFWVRKWAQGRDINALSNAAYNIRKYGIKPEELTT